MVMHSKVMSKIEINLKTIIKKLFLLSQMFERCVFTGRVTFYHYSIIILHVIHILNRKDNNDLNNIIPDIFHYFKAKIT